MEITVVHSGIVALPVIDVEAVVVNGVAVELVEYDRCREEVVTEVDTSDREEVVAEVDTSDREEVATDSCRGRHIGS